MERRFNLVEQIAVIQGRHKSELEPLNEELGMCERFIKDAMNQSGLQQAKIDGIGMAFFTTKDSVTVEDWDAALGFIREQSAYHMLNKAVNKTAVKEYIDEQKTPPPGVRYDSYRDLAWRRGKV